MALRLPTPNEIREELLSEWEALEFATYPTDLVNELAQSWLPVYYSDTISMWTELSDEDSNRFTEIRGGFNSSVTIYDLMNDDLYLYLTEQFSGVYEALLEEKEGK